MKYLDWTTADEDAEDTQMWEDNWDDDNVDDDFSTQLRYVGSLIKHDHSTAVSNHWTGILEWMTDGLLD